MEAIQIASKLLQPVEWRHPQVIQPAGGIEGFELAFRLTRNTLKVADELVLKQRLRRFVAE